MIIPVYINNKEYIINPKQDYIGEGSTARCYKIESENGPICVKLFNDDYMDNELEFQRYTQLVQNTFSNLAPYTSPILLSRYLVCDENGNYIGSSKDWVETNNDLKASTCIFSLPTEQGIDCFRSISDKIVIFNDAGIALSDWALYNALYGSIQGENSELYLVDDGDYRFAKRCKRTNDLQLRHLIEDLTDEYLMDWGYPYCTSNISSDMHAAFYPIQFLEKIGDGYSTLGEGAIQYAKKRT